ncbi:MAG: magnesium transporter CorA family protein [Dehalococcoidia bacterium]|jgi:magnesium transporter
MIKIFKTFGGCESATKLEKGCWIDVIQPTQDEIEEIINGFNLPPDSIQDILDADEMPRLEIDDTYTLIIMRIPVENSQNGIPYYTIPLGIFVTEDFTITICNQDNEIIQPKQLSSTADTYNFILKFFVRSASVFLKYLKQINQQTSQIEKDLEESIKNSELKKLLKMEKCLVYFITAIKSNEIVLHRLKNSKRITGEINEDLYEDALIENRQALEMAQIYSDILSGMMDAFASIISNNLNVIMKKLTLISIILMIPTLIASIFGMNIPNFMEGSNWALPSIIILSLSLSLISVKLMRNKQWF